MPPSTPTIQTEHLILRPFAESDLDDFFDCCSNPNLGHNAGWKPHETREESKEALQSVFMNQEGIWAIELKETNHIIGSVGIIPDPKRENPTSRMLGYWLKETHWGKGLMSEAISAILEYGFTTLNLNLISANCYPSNIRSRRLLTRKNFLYEGILHEAEQTYDGRIYDHLCFYLNKHNYQAHLNKNKNPTR